MHYNWDLSTPHGALGTFSSSDINIAHEYLSTPHGALGTLVKERVGEGRRESFNSTRCIRNRNEELYRGIEEAEETFNSTRCIRNRLLKKRAQYWINQLSTPHGALGTQEDLFPSGSFCRLSTPHGALGTRESCQPKPSSILLSTPHGALGTHCLWQVPTALILLSTPHGALGTT